MENKYFKVTCKCGHVGKKYFIRISFPIIAASRKDASSIARYIPRVKHDHKDAILECVVISELDFFLLKEENNNDPYLKCDCVQEQRNIIDFSSRLKLEPKYLNKEKRNKRDSVKYRLKKEKYILKSLGRGYPDEQFAY